MGVHMAWAFPEEKQGRFNGWISYTLSRSERKFDAINSGNYFPAKQDRTHDPITGWHVRAKQKLDTIRYLGLLHREMP